jgi:transposase-like protein
LSKQDRKKEWEAKIDAYKASGQSASAWCVAHNIKPHQLWYWMRKFKATEPTGKTPTKWLSVEVDEQSYETISILLVRVGSAEIEVKPGYDPKLLKEVVRTLKALC